MRHLDIEQFRTNNPATIRATDTFEEKVMGLHKRGMTSEQIADRLYATNDCSFIRNPSKIHADDKDFAIHSKPGWRHLRREIEKLTGVAAGSFSETVRNLVQHKKFTLDEATDFLFRTVANPFPETKRESTSAWARLRKSVQEEINSWLT